MKFGRVSKKFLLVFPPYCFPISPYMSLPILSSILNENGYESFCFDLNAEYHNKKCFNKSFLLERYNYLRNTLKIIKDGFFKYSDIEEEKFILKFFEFLLTFVKEDEEIFKVINEIESSVQVLKSNEFYDIKKFEMALDTVYKAETILFYSYFQTPALGKKIGSDLKVIEYFIKNKNLNPFYQFYIEKINEGFFKEYDYVMISQAFDVQNFAAWTLGYLLKKYTNVKVCIGGNYPSRLTETFKSNSKIFDEYFDYVLSGLGEESIIEFADFTHCRRNIEEVSGLIYKKQSEIFANSPKTFLENVNVRPKISFDGINFNDYLVPEVVIPLQVSKGCPWGKCKFCVFHEGKTKYQIIPAKKVAEEFKYLNDKYGITKFEFADESLSPKYYYDLAKEILNLKLNISYYGFARFDNSFTQQILEMMYKSGFKVFEWGYETPSKRIMELYNKGIDIDSRLSILERANEAGIWNHCLTIVDVPFETKEELLYDYDVYLKNSNLFNSRLMASFTLFKNTPFFLNAASYCMNNVKDDGNLSISASYKFKSQNEIYNDIDIKNKHIELMKHYKGKCWRTLMKAYDEYLFLYVSYYGKDKCIDGKF